MSEQELTRFIEKVTQLGQMVDSLEQIPERRKLLASCQNHEQVVRLAKEWGYEIGRRWGDIN